MMKKIVMSMVGLAAMAAFAAETIRFEAPDEDRPVVATGVELRGELDGSSVTEWDTLIHEDGWLQLVSGEKCVDVLVLNTPQVEGGRLFDDKTWGAERVHVVRDDVVIPNGVTLTLAAGCVVKFLPGSRLVVEGALVSHGACLADFADDSVAGDTNLDEADSMPSGIDWWLDDPAVSALATVRFLDGVTPVTPMRSYSLRCPLGALPTPSKDGMRFVGWFTEPTSGGAEATADTLVSEPLTLYARWQELALSLEVDHADLAANAGAFSFELTAMGEWTVETDSDWIALAVKGGSDDGTVGYSVTENRSGAARSGTIRVTLSGGTFRDFTVNQSGMELVATPVINPEDGTSFNGSSRRASISCATEGAQIRYTLDGSEPTETSRLYAKSFNVFDTTTIKAKAFKDGMLESATAVSRVVRLQTLAEAMNVPLWTVTTDDAAPWVVVTDESKDGVSSVRSGAIGNDEETSLTTTVDGSGTLSFWWKVSCEDDPDNDNWDFLAVSVDGAEVARIDGETDWRLVTIPVKGEGAHAVTWVCSKDYMDDEYLDVEDCGWVDQVSWSATIGVSSVPTAWLESLGLAKGGESAAVVANQDPDGDGFTTEEEYIIGTDPTDPESKFTASIEMVDGKPVITFEPNLLDERQYTTWGKKDLADPGENWREIKAGDEPNYNFFKMSVGLPE